jgi:hypothetical protein
MADQANSFSFGVLGAPGEPFSWLRLPLLGAISAYALGGGLAMAGLAAEPPAGRDRPGTDHPGRTAHC